jgi:hypothetical protein
MDKSGSGAASQCGDVNKRTTAVLFASQKGNGIDRKAALKLVAAFAPETSASASRITWCHNPQDHNLNSHHRGNLKNYIGLYQAV